MPTVPLTLSSDQIEKQAHHSHEVHERLGPGGRLLIHFAGLAGRIGRNLAGIPATYPRQSEQKPWLPMLHALPSKPFYEENEFPWLPAIRARQTAIRNELRVLLARPELFSMHRADMEEKGGWTSFDLIDAAREVPGARDTCPKTMALLDELPVWIYAGFSALQPGRHIAAHTGPTNASLVCHFGLMNCAGSYINVAGECREYAEGKLTVFDDTFLHAAENQSDKTRYTLMFYIRHPKLSAIEASVLKAIISRNTQPSDSNQNARHRYD